MNWGSFYDWGKVAGCTWTTQSNANRGHAPVSTEREEYVIPTKHTTHISEPQAQSRSSWQEAKP
jgi:hypothetical protein